MSIEWLSLLLFLYVYLILSETAQSGTANIDHPIVRVSLYPSHVPQGATPTLFCEVVGTSKAVTVKWMKDGNPLPMGNNRFRTAPWTEGHILQIRFLKASDAGSYTCVASGKDNSSQSDSKMLYVIVPPTIQKPGKVSVIEGSSAVLECNATSYLFIRWQHHGQFIDHLPQYEVDLLGARLSISRVHEADAGNYTCIAYNERFNRRETVELVVLGRPVITAHPRSTCIPPGRTVVMLCQYKSIPPATVMWLHNGNDIDLKQSDVEVQQSGSLVLQDVSTKDSGDYQCVVVNDVNYTESQSARLRVSETLNKTESISKHQASFGNNVILTCKSYGHTVATVDWLAHNHRVDPVVNPRYQTLLNGSLEIVNITYGDEATNFLCIPKLPNQTLVSMELQQVTVREPLGAPENIRIEQVSESSFLIVWKVVAANMVLSSVSHFRVSLTSESGSFSQSLIFPSDQRNCTIRADLLERNYSIQVTSVTSSGRLLPARPILKELVKYFLTEQTEQLSSYATSANADPTLSALLDSKKSKLTWEIAVICVAVVVFVAGIVGVAILACCCHSRLLCYSTNLEKQHAGQVVENCHISSLNKQHAEQAGNYVYETEPGVRPELVQRINSTDSATSRSYFITEV